MLLAWSIVAFAQEEPEPEAPPTEDPPAGRIELSADDDLGSALDDIEAEHERLKLDDPARLEDWAALPGGTLRGRWYAKPLLSLAHLTGDDGGTALRLGGAVGHQWWSLGERSVQLGGNTQLRASAPLGGASGHELTLDTDLGPWLGPIGLGLGPGLRWDRTDWRDAGVLDSGLAVGPRASVTAMVGPLRPRVGLEADWFVAGDRRAATSATAALPVLGDETTWTAGVAWVGKPIVWSLQSRWRETNLGPVLDVGLGLHLRPF